MAYDNLKILNSLTDDERRAIGEIVKQISEKGTSEDLTNLYYEDYEEIPVDLETFLCSETYLGNFTNNGKDIYNTWKEELQKVHNPANFVSQWAITGSTRNSVSQVLQLILFVMNYINLCV